MRPAGPLDGSLRLLSLLAALDTATQVRRPRAHVRVA
jgi:hypothetical protein